MKKTIQLSAIAIVAILGLFSSCKPKNPDNPDDARYIMKVFIEKRLKNPADADFGFCPIEKTESGSYRLKCYVDATNSFGGKIRNNFTCEVKHAYGETWDLLELTFE